MAYRVYTTDALVCGHKDRLTSDKAFQLFTRDAGMVWATAKSVRMEKSKNRYALQDFSFVRVSMVRGKGGWRVVGSEPRENVYYQTQNRETRATLRNVVRLLRRLIRGEEVHATLYDEVLAGLTCIHNVHAGHLESVLSLRILHALGYVPVSAEYTDLLEDNYGYNTIDLISPLQIHACNKAVKNALLSSQL